MTALLSAPPMRDAARDGSAPVRPSCAVCPAPRRSGRGRYCSAACRQRAFRLRHTALPNLEEAFLRTALRQRATLVAHTVYQCPSCEARFLGERRCPDCNRFCRALGLGGACPDCDQPVLLSDLLDLEV